MQYYMESFEEHFLNGKVRYNTEVLKIKRVYEKPSKSSPTPRPQWSISIEDKKTGVRSQLKYDKVVLCSGVCLVDCKVVEEVLMLLPSRDVMCHIYLLLSRQKPQKSSNFVGL